MPSNHDIFKLTNILYDTDIDNLNIQEAPKFLLRSMKNVEKDNNGHFKYINLVTYMIDNCSNREYYQGRGIRSKKNIYLYWNYAKSHKTANVPGFERYFIQVA